ncbi:DUF3363 domain-containing protein [Mesorhizobium sp. ESP6-5]|uniref:DUF3363 domain-containing protein n=1 Tax=Mesorhizobium sp. ESP6-5 TaxID=2876623 RepID=UPI001CCAF666|nr:DUF3363 domain-containing protein [Mesorhizobium sp. ESP6-5]
MDRRRQSLVEMAMPSLDDGRIRASINLLQWLDQHDVPRVGCMMVTERRLCLERSQTGEHVSGRLVEAAQLASGRFA